MNFNMNFKLFSLIFVLICFQHSIASGSNQNIFFINGDNNHLYQIVDKSSNWHEAKEYCHQLGGYLATITSQSENEFLIKNISENKSYWLGATDEAENGKWKWITEELFIYSNWQNDSLTNNENTNYLFFSNESKWNISNISKQLPLICEFDSIQKDDFISPTLNSKTVIDYANNRITVYWYEIGDFLFGFRSYYDHYYKRPPFDSSESTKQQLAKEVLNCEIEEWYIGEVSCNFTVGYDSESEHWEPTYSYSGHPRDRSLIIGCKRKNSNNAIIYEKDLINNINYIIRDLHTVINNSKQNSKTLQEIVNEQKLVINEKQEKIDLVKERFETLKTEKEFCDISMTKLTINYSESINKVEELNLLLDEKQKSNSILKGQLSEKDLIISGYMQRINELNNEIEQLNSLLKNSTRYSLTLNPGWHLVSSVDKPAVPKTEPPESIEIIYSFDSGTYLPVSILYPGRGYWVKILEQCIFTLEP